MLRVIVLFVFVVVALASEGKIQFNPWCLTLRAGRNRPWRALAFLPKSSVLTKIGIIYTQLLQEENIFPIMEPAKWSLMLAQKVSKSEWKTQSKISCHYTWLLHDKNCPSRWRFLRSLLTARNTAAKRKEKEKNERRKKFIKIEKPKDVGHFFVQKRPVAKFWFLRMPEPKCRKMQAAMLQMPFWLH